MKIAVAGTGYVGLSMATLLSQKHSVVAVDIVAEKVDMINRRQSPIQDEYIEKYFAEKDLDLVATLDAETAYRDAEFVIIAAPTNYDPQRNFFDTSAVEAVIAQAQASPRLRMNMDLRNSAADTSQRMLNAIEPGSVVPIHRHQKTSETVVLLRGRAVQYLYDDEGCETGSVLLAPLGAGCHVADGPCNDVEAVPAMQVEMGQWHRIESLESGTVILEMKDGAYEPIVAGDVMERS